MGGSVEDFEFEMYAFWPRNACVFCNGTHPFTDKQWVGRWSIFRWILLLLLVWFWKQSNNFLSSKCMFFGNCTHPFTDKEWVGRSNIIDAFCFGFAFVWFRFLSKKWCFSSFLSSFFHRLSTHLPIRNGWVHTSIWSKNHIKIKLIRRCEKTRTVGVRSFAQEKKILF